MNTKDYTLNLTWDSDNGHFESTGNDEWFVQHTQPDQEDVRFTQILRTDHAIIPRDLNAEISFTTGMFDDGGEWVAVIMAEGLRVPRVITGAIEFGDNGEELHYVDLNNKLNSQLVGLYK
jgi:hypothetical protein